MACDLIKHLFESTIKNLLKFLQVEWTNNLTEFYKTAENKRIISTPSYDQVNKPLYSQSIGRWKNYEDQFIETSKIFEKWLFGNFTVFLRF